jgi:small-conductance mechanosensitive channel
VMTIPLLPHTSPEALAALPGEIEAIVRAEPKASFDRAHIVRFAAASIDLEVVFFVESPEARAQFQVRHEVIIALMKRLKELGVDFAPPQAPPPATGVAAG